MAEETKSNNYGGLIIENPSTNTKDHNDTVIIESSDNSQASDKEHIDKLTYTPGEIANVNNILVTVPDQSTPIVIFFGSQASGKTLALLRMIRFFENHEHSVVPERVFRPKTDMHYANMCDGLKTMAYSQYAPSGTDIISFMLAKVLDKQGRPLCQFLEAPGEHYFDGKPDSEFPTYIHHIIGLPNRKVWVFFVEQDWGENQTERDLYAQKICAMQNLINPGDKIVFLCNKVDKHPGEFRADRRPNKGVFFTNIYNQYPGIFSRYRNEGFFSKLLWGAYKFRFVCFSSGVFTSTADGRQVWIPGSDEFYCQELWNAIK